MNVQEARDLLWAVRERRRGEGDQRRRLTSLPEELVPLLRMPLGDLCSQLAARVMAGPDPRAAEACVRFYGLGQLPEDLRAIAASFPRAHDPRARLGQRRVEQLVVQAEEDLAARLTVWPVSPGPARPHPSVDGVFDADPSGSGSGRSGSGASRSGSGSGSGRSGSARGWQLRVLLRAWADVPNGDHRSASALRLFEEERGFRRGPPHATHRETRRRLRKRARAILSVAIERSGYDRAATSRHHLPPDTAVPLLLGPCQLTVVDGGPALDTVLRSGLARLDRDALEQACAYARQLVWIGSPGAAPVLGALRLAVLRAPHLVPPSVVTRILMLATIIARESDDPAGIVAGWEALRIARAALFNGIEVGEGRLVVSRAMRAAEELAELYDRLGLPHQAMQALAISYELLDEHGDPEHDEEPFGWPQQLLYTRAIVRRRATTATTSPQDWLRAAQSDASRSAQLVWRGDALPLDRALSAQAVLIEAVLDEVEARQAEGDTTGAAAALRRARQAIASTSAGWAGVRGLDLTPRSNRLATLRSACRLALLEGDHDEYRERREVLRAEVGEWMTAADIEELAALEDAAALRGIRPLGLAAKGIRTERRIGQRVWARGLDETGYQLPPPPPPAPPPTEPPPPPPPNPPPLEDGGVAVAAATL